MKLSKTKPAGTNAALQAREQASARMLALLMIVFLAGMAVSGLWFYQGRRPSPAKAEATVEPKPGRVLSASTGGVLKRLRSPVEIRSYAILDPAGALDSLRAFGGRVDQLLDAYEREAPGKIKVIRIDSQSYSNAAAAAGDGLKPFNIEKGNACFFGLVVAGKGHKETLASLSPEWEDALEADVTRAIARVDEVPNQTQLAVTAMADPGAVAALRQAIPNVDSVSLEEGTRLLRDATLNEIAQVAQEMDAKVKAAEQSYLQAQTNQSEADLESARKQLQQLRAEQNAKLKLVVAKSQAELQALERLKVQ
jgi:hypothetical protein